MEKVQVDLYSLHSPKNQQTAAVRLQVNSSCMSFELSMPATAGTRAIYNSYFCQAYGFNVF